MAGLIVHEWAEMSGGAENVVDQFLLEFPDSQLQVLWNDAKERFPNAKETWLARTPLRKHKALTVPLLPLVWRNLRAEEHPSWLLISSHLFAHHARVKSQPSIPKLVYAHTPARYIWDPGHDPRGNRSLVRLVSSVLKPIDRSRAQEATSIAANSRFTSERIERTWGVESEIIYPPVCTTEISEKAAWADELNFSERVLLESLPNTFLLGASRWVEYKRLDKVIEFGQRADVPVVIAGAGSDGNRLRALAQASKVPVTFVENPSTAMVRALYQRSLAFIYLPIEDFGIMPVEAMAAGTPVISNAMGGAAETVLRTGGGAILESMDAAEVRRALETVVSIPRDSLKSLVGEYSAEKFRGNIRNWVDRTI